MLGSEPKNGIMTYLSKKVKKIYNGFLPEMKVSSLMTINQEWRIVRLVDVEFGVMRHSAESKDKTPDHHKHQDQLI